MSRNLVIVESPAKAKTIEKFLGKEFKVASSFGHISDLPSNELGVNIDNNFSPKYIVSDDKKKIVSELKSLVKKSDLVWLASDEDREGEAIAWHLFQTLKLDKNKTKRIVFHEITKNAILKALDKPREINKNIVDAQQARRVLDRLVGYQLSPILWKKVKGGLSAGRVQSVSVRLISEREREIIKFSPKSTYQTKAEFETSSGNKIKAQALKSFLNSDEVKSFLQINKESKFIISEKNINPVKKSPSAPFITSTLQQEASRKLYFSVSKTMNIAQRLYESGLITYMRTDSVNISKEAQLSILELIKNKYGEKYVNPRSYKSKSKGAQEAHEAIRPTNFSKLTIDGDYDQKRLYELIWRRTVSSQMTDSQIERTNLKINSINGENIFSAKGEVLIFDGFLKIYIEGIDNVEEEAEGIIPEVKIGDEVMLNKIISTQKFSRPPYRYTEASLVKKLEDLGIGRPSTYAPTISTVQNRGYVSKGDFEGFERSYNKISLEGNQIIEEKSIEITGSNKGKLVPTDIGLIVNDFLVNNFKNILDYNFTAEVEKNFDQIAVGQQNWTSMIEDFYKDFNKIVNFVQENAERESGERILGKDPISGREVKVRLGRFGPLAQIGNVGDDQKPVFASLTSNQKLENISFDEVMELFKLPKELGEHNSEIITVNNGRFGPYIKYGKKFVSLPKDIKPTEIDYETSIKLISEKEKLDAPIFIFENLPVTKGKGRFGPFIKWNSMFINVNKSYDFENLVFEDVKKLIEEKIQKEKDKIIHNWVDKGIRVEKARWGRSVILSGKIKIQLPKEVDSTKLNLEDVEKIIEQNKNSKVKKNN